MLKNIVLIFIGTFFYAFFRYNIAGEIPMSDIPTLIVNKAIAFSMIVILGFFIFSKKQTHISNYRSVFKAFAVLHVVLSTSLLSQEYFPKLFFEEKLTIWANFAVLAGGVTFAYLVNRKIPVNNMLLFALVLLHLAFIGAIGWFDVWSWNGGLPPISLLCFLILAIMSTFEIVINSRIKNTK